jgi:hypothetical protein
LSRYQERQNSFSANMMIQCWPKDTTNHQDHVIAHVIGASVLGYFILDETLYLLLDIGFIWIIYLDGEMVLLPHPVATAELEVNQQVREQIKADVDLMMQNGSVENGLNFMTPAPVLCLLTAVALFGNDDGRQLLLIGDEANLSIETTISTREIRVAEYR